MAATRDDCVELGSPNLTTLVLLLFIVVLFLNLSTSNSVALVPTYTHHAFIVVMLLLKTKVSYFLSTTGILPIINYSFIITNQQSNSNKSQSYINKK